MLNLRPNPLTDEWLKKENDHHFETAGYITFKSILNNNIAYLMKLMRTNIYNNNNNKHTL